MISVFDVVVLGVSGWIAFRLWEGSTSLIARAVTIGSLSFLAWSFVGP